MSNSVPNPPPVIPGLQCVAADDHSLLYTTRSEAPPTMPLGEQSTVLEIQAHNITQEIAFAVARLREE